MHQVRSVVIVGHKVSISQVAVGVVRPIGTSHVEEGFERNTCVSGNVLNYHKQQKVNELRSEPQHFRISWCAAWSMERNQGMTYDK